MTINIKMNFKKYGTTFGGIAKKVTRCQYIASKVGCLARANIAEGRWNLKID